MAELQAQYEALKAAHDKLKRRAQRNERAQFARGLMQGILSMQQPGDVVLDCGANVGAVTGPLAETILMPLYSGGLCDPVIITPSTDDRSPSKSIRSPRLGSTIGSTPAPVIADRIAPAFT